MCIGRRLPDHESRVEEFLLRAAALAPELQFCLGGEGWAGKAMPDNVRWLGHVSTEDHNPLNCSSRMVLNINRHSMAEVGFAPPTRIFEAARASTSVITASSSGIVQSFFPAH